MVSAEKRKSDCFACLNRNNLFRSIITRIAVKGLEFLFFISFMQVPVHTRAGALALCSFQMLPHFLVLLGQLSQIFFLMEASSVSSSKQSIPVCFLMAIKDKNLPLMHFQTPSLREFFYLNGTSKVMITPGLKGQPVVSILVQLYCLQERASFNELVHMETK